MCHKSSFWTLVPVQAINPPSIVPQTSSKSFSKCSSVGSRTTKRLVSCGVWNACSGSIEYQRLLLILPTIDFNPFADPSRSILGRDLDRILVQSSSWWNFTTASSSLDASQQNKRFLCQTQQVHEPTSRLALGLLSESIMTKTSLGVAPRVSEARGGLT